MRWATRAGVHIDGAARAGLIRRFLDADAQFVFVTDPDDVPADATPFDMRSVDLGHHGGDCTFETILRRHELSTRSCGASKKVVHEADLDDERYDAPEAAGLDVLLRGLSMIRDDERVLTLTGPCSTPCTSTGAASSSPGESPHEPTATPGHPTSSRHQPRHATKVRAVGLNSFGRPAGQIAVMHRLVVEQRRCSANAASCTRSTTACSCPARKPSSWPSTSAGCCTAHVAASSPVACSSSPVS